MEYGNLNSIYRIKLLALFITIFVQGYSSSSDTIKKQICSNGFLFQINEKEQCVDTTIMYYPVFTEYWDELDQSYNMMKSLNLQLLGESKWYDEDIQEDRLRIFLIEYPPSFDSIVLFSFLKKDCNNIQLLKKEMPVFYYPYCFLPDSSYFLHENIYFWPDYNYVLPDSTSCLVSKNNIEEVNIVNYKQTEFTISKSKIQKLRKQLYALKNCETFDRYGVHPTFVIEYVYKGNYHLLIAQAPDMWCKTHPECKQIEKNCHRKSGFKIMKWLKQYL